LHLPAVRQGVYSAREDVAAPACRRARKQRIIRQGAKLCKGKANALPLQMW